MVHVPDGIVTEVFLGSGRWEDISTRVRRSTGIRITRQRKNERGRVSGSMSMTIEDPDAYFSDLNPLSPYYGLIGPNTQVRVSVGPTAPQIEDFERTVTNGWTPGVLDLPGGSGNYVSSPDAAALDITGDIDIRALIAPDDWTPPMDQCVISKSNTSGNQRSYQLILQSPGNLRFSWSTAGTGATTTDVNSTVATGFANGSAHWVRATLDVDNGASGHVVTFYTSENGSDWTQLGIEHTGVGTTSIFAGTATANVGARSAGTADTYAGLIYRAEIRNGIGGTVVANPRFDQVGAGNTSFTDSTGKVWTLNGTAVLINDSNALLWTNSGGTVPGEYDVNGTQGVHTHGTVSQLHHSLATVTGPNMRVRATTKLSVGTLSGGAVSVWALGRVTDASNYYAAIATFNTDGTVGLAIQKRVGGSLQPVASGVSTHSGYTGLLDDNEFTVELYCEGPKLYAKIWDSTSEPEPNGWTLYETDQSLTTGNGFGVADRREGGNTDTNLEVRYSEVRCYSGTIRAHMEVPNLGAHTWTHGGKDITMSIQAADIKRRLGAPGVLALESPMNRFAKRTDASGIVGYWSGETGQFTGEVGPTIGGIPLTVVGFNISFGSTSPFPGIASMISLGSGAKLIVPSMPATDTGVVKGQVCVQFPEDGIPDDTPIMQITTINDSTVRKWYLRYQESTGGALAIVGYDHSFSLVENSGYIGFAMNGKSALIQWEVRQNGANADWMIATHEMQPDGTVESLSSTNTFPTTSVGAPSGGAIAPAAGMDGCLVGHIAIMNSATALDGAEVALTGHIAETSTERFARLCEEEEIAYQIIGDAVLADSAVRMGPQRTATLLQNLEDCEDAEHGILYGARHFCGLVLRTHETLLGQSGPGFSYEDGMITGEPFPNPDEALWGNDVTAKRTAGSEYRSVEETGPMSVQNPPNGIGRYQLPVPVNVAYESQLPDVARWNQHVGTWRGARYPTIQFDTHRPQWTTALVALVDKMDIGDYFSVQDTPAWLPPGDIEVLGQGYAEWIRNIEREIVFSAVPAGPYEVAVRGVSSRRDSAASVLSSDALAGATSLSVAVTGPLWTTGSVDFDILVEGSILHVTNISGASSPQTFTVDATRVNGVDKALPAGSAVHIHPIPVRALTDFNMNLTMHEDLGGTRVRGIDFPPSVWTPGESTGSFTSATYIEDTDKVGVVFTPSSTASFVIHIAGELDCSDATGSTFMSFIIRRGAVLGEGNPLVAADDTTAIMLEGTDQGRIARAFLFDVTTTQLPPGKPINITLAHRRATAGNSVIIRRMLLVRPVRTQGGLPGSLIEAEPQAEDDVQDASDTSTSTSYTTADMTQCGTAFVAGPSGKVLVQVAARMDHSTNAPTFVGYEIREGSTVGSGTVFQAVDDTRSLMMQNVNRVYMGITFPVTGLTPGASYNIRLLHKTTSGTLTLENRLVHVEQVA